MATSPVGTFLHSRKFLSYHGDRFKDYSLLLKDEKGRLLGVFPAAINSEHFSDEISSHPGSTYGGLVIADGVKAGQASRMLESVFLWYRQRGIKFLVYKSIPAHFHKRLYVMDLYELWRHEAVLFRRDLWNVISLEKSQGSGHRHRRSLKKALTHKLTVVEDNSRSAYEKFYLVLSERLFERYHTSPVHSLEDLHLLRERFPDEITLFICVDESGEVLAGSWIFKIKKRVWHTQYIASSEEGREKFATIYLFNALVQFAKSLQVSYFSFGSSTEDNGRKINSGLFDFKENFGAIIQFQDFYRLDLAKIKEL